MPQSKGFLLVAHCSFISGRCSPPMDALYLFFAALLVGAAAEKDMWEPELTATGSENNADELYYSPAGPEKMSIEIVEEEGENNALGFQVDAETIRKAEKMADRDLINGLNRILKNNETLQDVFKAESVYQFT